MQGTFLKLYVSETQRYHRGILPGSLLYEWILQQAQAIGIPGGSALRALAGFGRHGQLHEQHFFELAGEVPILLEFFAEDALIERLIGLLNSEKLTVFYVKFPAQSGFTNQ